MIIEIGLLSDTPIQPNIAYVFSMHCGDPSGLALLFQSFLYQTQQEYKPYKFTMPHRQKLRNCTGAETLLLFHIPEKVDFVGVGVSTHPVSPLAFPE